MNDHYYSEKPRVESERKTWTYQLKGNTFTFHSDKGVFSKNEVDFGSKLLIETFQMPEIEGPILDIGCGYGPIGLSLAKEYPAIKVDMVDINERAVELSKENAKVNRIENVQVFQSYLFEEISKKKYAAILTNPPIRAGKKVVHEIFEKSYTHLYSGGELWVVIQKKQGAPSAIEKLNELYSEADVIEKKKGYYIICAKKY
ncbi:class I SAM-dependent methyltransferase [Metabacillus arenae]|uniref:Class I SAM-dependent methyltransferase n=1 Tax=Metabacillus arenae TaxID=2771434 RepID=A0A926S003_9BACI|nr:class I SAM-dependent methyltransferase [Metabacillus arenae]MBD1382772.1 class I SAM-dependent methyltransferase [Metabacillus arenae]